MLRISSCLPTKCAGHHFRQSIPLGATEFTLPQIWQIIYEMSADWPTTASWQQYMPKADTGWGGWESKQSSRGKTVSRVGTVGDGAWGMTEMRQHASVSGRGETVSEVAQGWSGGWVETM